MSRKSTQSKKQPQVPKPLHYTFYKKLNHRSVLLPGWQFDKLFLPHMIEIDKVLIWEWREPNREAQYAILYGLKAIYTETKVECCGAYFIRYKDMVHQVQNPRDAQELYDLFLKQWKHKADWQDYDDWEQQQKAEEKEIS